MAQMNPYEPPVDLGENVAVGSYRREGDYLLVSDGAVLPARCVRINQPIDADGVTSARKLIWYPRWVWALTLVGLLPISVVLAAVFQKGFMVTYSLCRREHLRFRNRLIVGWLLFVGGFAQMTGAVVWASASSDYWPLLILSGGILMMIFAAVSIIRGVPLRAVSSVDGSVGLKGCSKEFLDSIGPA